MKTKKNYLRKDTGAIRQMRFEVGKNPFSKESSTKTKSNTMIERPTMLKITFQQNKQRLSTRMVTSSILNTLNDKVNNRPMAHHNQSSPKQQSIKENPFDKTMSNDNESDACVFVNEENDEVIFVSETSCDIQVSRNERNCVKENAKRFGVNSGKVRIFQPHVSDGNYNFIFHLNVR